MYPDTFSRVIFFLLSSQIFLCAAFVAKTLKRVHIIAWNIFLVS